MQLILVRHAVACPRNFQRWPDDDLRPLTPEGRRKFRAAARGIRRVLPTVDVLLSSGLVRADETARILTQEAHWPEAQTFEPLRPARSAAAVLEAVRRRMAATAARTIALVGHEPQIARVLAAALAGEAAVGCDFRKGAIAVIDFDGVVQAGRGQLAWFAPPVVVRRLRQKRKA